MTELMKREGIGNGPSVQETYPSRHPAFSALATALAVSGVMAIATPGRAQQGCGPLAPPSGPTIQVSPGQAGQLRGIVLAAEAGTTILLENGTYDLSGGDDSSRLSFYSANVTLRSFSGDRDGVILDGGYGTNEIIAISASKVIIADLTVMRAYAHPIDISGQPGNPINGILLHNLRIVDPREQAIKVNPVGDGYVDNSTIECCSIELTDAGRTHVNPIPGGCYTGGIDVHEAQGWVVRRNRIEGFWCDSGLSEHGIHFWQCCRDTLVEENVIFDCARGIGLGLSQTGSCRTYPDDPYPTAGFKDHIDGVIRNNFVAAADRDLQRRLRTWQHLRVVEGPPLAHMGAPISVSVFSVRRSTESNFIRAFQYIPCYSLD